MGEKIKELKEQIERHRPPWMNPDGSTNWKLGGGMYVYLPFLTEKLYSILKGIVALMEEGEAKK